MPLFFSSDPFFAAVAAAYFPGRDWRADTVSVEGCSYRVLVVDGRSVDKLRNTPFYYAPLPEGRAARAVPFLRNTVRRVADGAVAHGQPDLRVSPFVDWTRFATWDAYVGHGDGHASSSRFATAARKRRKLGREVGPVVFTLDDPDAHLIVTAARWKAARLGGRPAAGPGHRLNLRLAESGHLSVSSLRVDGRPVAIILGHVWEQTYYFRAPAFDPSFAPYSPGTILLQDLLRHTYDAGFHEFDLLPGDHDYKWWYATGARLIGPAGRRPPVARIARLGGAAVDRMRGMIRR